MTRYLIVTIAILGLAGSASAQFPMQPFSPYQSPSNPSPFLPNIYNPVNQPLSPYLNLLRGGNPSVNYFYGVRPGTVGGFGQGIGAPFTAAGGNRQLFFPQFAAAPDPLLTPESGPGAGLPPAGHPVVFNNTGGYFPAPAGGPGGRGGMRPGLAGIGMGRTGR